MAPWGKELETCSEVSSSLHGRTIAHLRGLVCGPQRDVLTRILILGYREPLLYNLSVAREFLKQVYVAERLQPPTSFTTVSNAYGTIWSRLTTPAYLRDVVQSGEWAKLGVYAVEAYGIFKVSCT